MIDELMSQEPTCALVETENYESDYPNEKLVCLFYCSRPFAKSIAEALNYELCNKRYYKVVDLGYELKLGFEP